MEDKKFILYIHLGAIIKLGVQFGMDGRFLILGYIIYFKADPVFVNERNIFLIFLDHGTAR
jgi:hypothetical protein